MRDDAQNINFVKTNFHRLPNNKNWNLFFFIPCCGPSGQNEGVGKSLLCQISHCFFPIPWLMCCSHSFNIWKLGRAAGSRFQHCFMMLYTTSGQPSGQSILYPFSTRGTTSFNGYRNEKTKLLGKEHHLFCSGLLLHEGQFDARNVHGKLLGIYSTYSSSNKDLLLFFFFWLLQQSELSIHCRLISLLSQRT